MCLNVRWCVCRVAVCASCDGVRRTTLLATCRVVGYVQCSVRCTALRMRHTCTLMCDVRRCLVFALLLVTYGGVRVCNIDAHCLTVTHMMNSPDTTFVRELFLAYTTERCLHKTPPEYIDVLHRMTPPNVCKNSVQDSTHAH